MKGSVVWGSHQGHREDGVGSGKLVGGKDGRWCEFVVLEAMHSFRV